MSILVDATRRDLPIPFVFDATPEMRGALRARQNTFPGCLCRAHHHPALFEQEKTLIGVFSCSTDPLSTTRRPSWVSGCVQWPPAPLEQEKTPNRGVFSCSKLSHMEPFMGFFLARSLLNTNRHSFWWPFGAHR